MTNGLLNIWLNICSFPHLLSPSSYMTLLPIHSEFLIYENIFFLFYQCTIYRLPGSLLIQILRVKLRDIFAQMSTKTWISGGNIKVCSQLPLIFVFAVHTYLHNLRSYNTFIQIHSSRHFFIFFIACSLSGKNLPWVPCQDLNSNTILQR